MILGFAPTKYETFHFSDVSCVPIIKHRVSSSILTPKKSVPFVPFRRSRWTTLASRKKQ